MASSDATASHPPSPQVVGIAFVEQYYQILHQSPESVYKFYQESSILSRPNSDGVMTSVTTTRGINDMVLSLEYKDYIAEIITVDSQPSYNEGVFILVTGCLTGQDKIQKKFTQSFFLAPQDRGVYFVLNDMFRFVEEIQTKETPEVIASAANEDTPTAPVNPDPELEAPQDHHQVESASLPSEEVPEKSEEASRPTENKTEDKAYEQEIAVVDPPARPSEEQPVSEVTSPAAKDDVPKKSYASIVRVAKGISKPAPVHVPTTKTKPARVNPEKQTSTNDKPPVPEAIPAPAPETSSAGSNSTSEKNSSHDAEGYSIYIRNLPLGATSEQVEVEFKKFGPIKPGGVQVRSHKIDHFCFGFVEFESVESMQAAIQASSILIGTRHVFVEEKKTTTRVVNGVVTNAMRGRYPPGRGGFRNDNFRGRGGFAGYQGFGRNDFRGRGEFVGGGRGEFVGGGRGQGYQQRVFQNGYGRIGRPTPARQGTVSA